MITKNIGIFFGGKSPEHDVSIITAQLIISELKKTDFLITPVYLDKDGVWRIGEALASLKTFTNPLLSEKIKNLPAYYIDLEKSNGRLVFKRKGFSGKEIVVDLAFPAFHGLNGEDGTIQGLFEIIGLPYVGCGVMASAITMDKITTKHLYNALGLPTTKFIAVTNKEFIADRKNLVTKIIKDLKYPIFVKPSRLGSSIGISKVSTEIELENALELAFHYDSRAVVEEGVNDVSDLTCSVIGHHDLIVSEVQESLYNKDLFSYEDKYLNDGGAQLGNATSNIIIPAGLPDNITAKIKDYSRQVYRDFDCSGIARIDFLYDKSKKILYVNEVNTLPGTLYHHLWKASGVEIQELIEKLIGYAEERQLDVKKYETKFNSHLLSMANSIKLKSGKLS